MGADIDPIAVQLRTARKRRGWSLIDAGDRTGLGGIVLGSYERGDRRIPLPNLRQWVEGFGFRLLVLDDADQVGLHGTDWIEHAVRYGDGDLIVCDNAEEAAAIASRMPGSRVVSRRVQATGWRDVEANLDA